MIKFTEIFFVNFSVHKCMGSDEIEFLLVFLRIKMYSDLMNKLSMSCALTA